MNLRKRALSAGWYPENRAKMEDFLKDATKNKLRGKAEACVTPHAGWYFSGSLSALSVHALKPAADTVIIIGGHLPGTAPALFAMEDYFSTPIKNLESDQSLRDALIKEFDGRSDDYADNSVEVILPMAAYFYPSSKIIWMRFPSRIESYEMGKKILSISQNLEKKVVVIASTDLTHYGSQYHFMPQGPGAIDWVKNVNDASFIVSVAEGNAEAVLQKAMNNRAACSAGAVLGAMGYAHALGIQNAKIAGYHTSADIELAESFVGYASLYWER
ncbi:MAG: AmmeMemoRadiSam system protein B [Treponema sp.]|jgi:AmmeMemoRadiSam system protein B|nr:AmmeMemoRadiSam system protein B [Treponema sp.]